MKISKSILLAGLIAAAMSAAGAAQATTVISDLSTESTYRADLPALESNAALGPSATLPETASWALMLLGLAGVALTGSQQAKKRRESIASF